MGKFNIPLWNKIQQKFTMEKIIQEETNKKTGNLSNLLHAMVFTDTPRRVHTAATEDILFSSVQRQFTYYRTPQKLTMMTETALSIFPDHNGMKLEIYNQEEFQKIQKYQKLIIHLRITSGSVKKI